MKAAAAASLFLAAFLISHPVAGQTPPTDQPSAEAAARSDLEQAKKAAEWAAALKLDDPDKEARVKDVVTAHLRAVRDWHNSHPFTTVPAGINDLPKRSPSNSSTPTAATGRPSTKPTPTP